MSDRVTSIRPRDREVDPGNLKGMSIAAWGRVSRAEMLQRFRDYHFRQIAHSYEALALNDDELIVETYLGSIVKRNPQEVTE